MRASLSTSLFAVATIFSLVSCVSDSPVTPADIVDSGSSDASTGVDSQSPLPDSAPPSDAALAADTNTAFDPSKLGTLELWVAADVGVTNNSNFVWTDQSPKTHVVQYDAKGTCQKPTVAAAAINGLPAIQFNSACLTVSAGFQSFTNGLAIFVVAQPQSGNSPFYGAEGAFLDLNQTVGTQSNEITFGRNPTPTNTTSGGDFQLQIYNGGAACPNNAVPQCPNVMSSATGTAFVNGTTSLFEAVLPADPAATDVSGKLFLNGQAIGASPNTPQVPGFTSGGHAENYIGLWKYEGVNTYPNFNGLIAEMMVFSSTLTDAQRQAIESHLKTKWGL